MKEHNFEPKGIYYRTNTFEPGRQTLVFVHGLSGSSSAWAKFEKKFGENFNILSYDLRGHGKSWKPQKYEEYAIEYSVEDLNELLEYLQIKNFVLISHSFGCFIAFEYLKKHQDNVSQTVFLSPNYSARKMLSAKLVLPFLNIGVALLKWLPIPLKAGGHIDYSKYSDKGGDWNIPITTANIINTSLRVYLYATKQSYGFDAEEYLPDISVPTLVVHGVRDTIFPVRYGIEVAGKIPGAKLVLVPEANHILVINDFPDVPMAIENFVI